MRKTSSAVILLATALTAIVIGLTAPSAQAERQVQLITFTGTSWRYEASGANQMEAWRSRTFPDAGWPSGMGLLGGFTGAPDVYPYPFNTIISPYNDQQITYYFRAHFNMAASDFVWPLTLMMSNLVDDGCIVYLNSNSVRLIRMAANAGYLTPATGGPAAEGAYEPTMMIATNGLVVGDNVIAVEVHQTGTSSDIAHGLSLTAIVPTALAITSQPPSQLSITVGQSVILNFGVSGGPGLFQWQTNNGSGTFININTVAARTNSYTFTPSAPGTYVFRCVASNGVNTVISSTCTVTVSADKSGPLMLSAIVLEEANRTNRIQIVWNERLTNSTVCAGCG
ncbi:MAG: immunoglobulin domain-containing protein, partial [Gammaproteobacteria bacterium]